MFIHPCTFYERLVREHAAYKRLHILGQHAFRHALRLNECLILHLDFFFRSRQCTVVFAYSLIAYLRRIAVYESDRFRLREKCFGIYLDSPYGSRVGTSPVEIRFAVIVKEKIGIPERKSSVYLLIRAVEDILCPPVVAFLFSS